MNQLPSAAPPQGQARPSQVPGTPHTIWDRLLDDLHKRPRRYVNGVVVLSIPVLLAVLGFKFWRTSQENALGSVAVKWQEISASDTPPKVKAAALEELAPEIKTDDQRAFRLYDLASTYKDIAEAATTQDEKVGAYEKCLAACRDLKSKYPNSLWCKMPTRPPTAQGAATLPAVAQIEDYAQHQLDWFKQHPYTGTIEPDPSLSVTFELEDGRKIVIGKFFSRVAPFHVQNFIELVRRGYFDGTAFSRVSQGYKKGATPKQGEHPPNIALEGGHPMTKVTPDDRDDDDSPSDIGYSIKDEANVLSPTRGSVVGLPDSPSGGDSSSRFKVYAEEPSGSQEAVFAEVTEGLDIIDASVNAPSPENHPQWSKDLLRIKKATVQGSVLKPPERPFPPELKMPEAPKPASSPASRPVESNPSSREGSESKGTETKPATAPESKPK